MIAKIKFSLLQRSMSITMASLSVLIYLNLCHGIYSLLITRPCFTRKATPPLVPVQWSYFIVS